jgi:hypothetical protein
MKIANAFLSIGLFICLASCNNDEFGSRIDPSTKLIEMEGEGGQEEVTFSGSDWKIEKIINLNGYAIFGDSYDTDGNLMRENHSLTLVGLGGLEAIWVDKGFNIVRNTPTSLKIALQENSTGEVFTFVIVLSDGDESREITVKQNESQGYAFENIEYAIKADDGDSLYIKPGTTYRHEVSSPREFSFLPIGGVNVDKRYYFESMEVDAFVWLKDDAVKVELPVDIRENEVYLGEKGLYAETPQVKAHDFMDLRETVVVSEGESEFSTEIEYRKRKVSYTLYLRNNRTNEQKIIEGKWIEIAPTGKYTVIWN